VRTRRENLENQQISVYVGALICGAAFGLLLPNTGSTLNMSISPILAVLLYGMFAQIPFLRLRAALANKKFVVALFVVNFVAVPILVWILASFLPDQPVILLGMYLVLLTPCIDYVIVFTQLGRGDEKLMLASTPFLFLAQILLLPFYLWVFIGSEAAAIIQVKPFFEAFLSLIIAPLALAIITQLWAKRSPRGHKVLNATAWLPVPLMALTLFVVVASQINKVYSDFHMISQVIPLYVAYMIIAPLLARAAARWFRLGVGAGRALVFSAGTRNSLVVLPLALALPEPWATTAAAVIVTQTIVELVGELIYIRLVPRLILRGEKEGESF
jgi:ACR3 family arsenite transporter